MDQKAVFICLEVRLCIEENKFTAGIYSNVKIKNRYKQERSNKNTETIEESCSYSIHNGIVVLSDKIPELKYRRWYSIEER